MTLNEVFFGLITAAIIVLVVFLVRLIIRVGEAVKSTTRVLETTDQNLREAITEANESLRSLRHITDNIGVVTKDVSSFSGSIRDVGEEIRQLTSGVKKMGDVVHDLGTETVASVCGLRAGFKTGLEVLLKSLFR